MAKRQAPARFSPVQFGSTRLPAGAGAHRLGAMVGSPHHAAVWEQNRDATRRVLAAFPRPLRLTVVRR